METAFNFDTNIEETSWLVNKLVPLGHLCIFLSQAGVGKSLLLEFLAICISRHQKFCGFDASGGDALIIDQDTPWDTINKRLLRFGKAVEPIQNHKLYLESMRGYQLKNKTLYTAINDYNGVRLVGIDSLHSVFDGLNPNMTSDASKLATLKEKCINDCNTIIINHHISEKKELSVKELMSADPHRLSMGSSAIIQQADTYYIIGATAEAGKTDHIYVRIISKRATIPTPPIVLRLLPTENGGEIIEFEGYYEPDLDETERDIMTLFKEKRDIEHTVKEVYEAMGHQHGEIKVREALASLDKKSKLLMSRHKSNLFKYRLP